MTKISIYTQNGLLATTTNATPTFMNGLLSRFGMSQNIDKTKGENPFPMLTDENKFEFGFAPTPRWYETLTPLPIPLTLNKDLFRKPKNNFVYFSENALKESDSIKLNKKFNTVTLEDIKNIPNNTMETFLLGSRFFRYWVVDEKMYVMHFQQWRSVEQFDLNSKFEKKVFNEFAERVGGVDELRKYIEGKMIDLEYNRLFEKHGKEEADVQKWLYEQQGGREVLDNTVVFYLDLKSEKLEFNKKDHELLREFIQLLVFLRFGDVSVKVVKSNTSEKHKGSRYDNESSKTVTVVMKNWNTISINKEGFPVREHFHTYWTGKGRTTKIRKLLAEYPKGGYVKKGGGVKGVNLSIVNTKGE